MKYIFAIISLAAAQIHLVSADSGEFNYDDQQDWKSIIYEEPVTNDCAKNANSPIDIPPFDARSCEENDSSIQLMAGDCAFEDIKFSSSKNGVKGEYVGNCTKPSAKFPDYPETFVAASFHLHTGCEHLIVGEGCDAEMHIVHYSNDTNMDDVTTYKAAVIGIRMSNDAVVPHSGIEDLLGCWFENHNAFVEQCNPDICDVSRMYIDQGSCKVGAFDVYSLIPEGSGYYNYMGGLTTPPCSQIVRWNLMDTKASLTLKQWSAVANLILGYGGHVDDEGNCIIEHSVASFTGSTSRDPQPINGRTVSHRCHAIA